MKKVFLLMLALASVVNATDTVMNCTQQGFQVSAQFGWGLTTPSNTVYGFTGPTETGASITSQLDSLILEGTDNGLYDISSLSLDYSNVSTWQSDSAMIAGLGLGYKWLLNCNQYSVTAGAFIQYNGVSMTSNLTAQLQQFQVQVNDEAEQVNSLIGGLASSNQYAGNVTLSSGPVFGFNFLLAKEFNWGNAGLVLGMKFNSYKLSYIETNPVNVVEGVIATPGYADTSISTNDDISQSIESYAATSSKTQVATGFTVGFATNYYIADNLSAGFTLFYDMYAPVKFNLENIDVSPYVYEADEVQPTDSGNIKFQNNTVGVLLNLTYSFGAN